MERMRAMKLSIHPVRLQPGPLPAHRSKAVKLRLLLTAAAAFTFSQGQALGPISPFSVAFAASVPYEHTVAAFLGAGLGNFFAIGWRQALKYTAAAALICLVRRLVETRFSHCKRAAVLPAATLLCMACTNAAFFALTEFEAAALLPAVCETVLAAVFTALFLRAFQSPVLSVGLMQMAAQDTAVLLLSLGALLCCAAGITVGMLAPARIAACFLVLFFADFKGAKVGTLAGVCVGAALSVDPAHRFLFAVYAVSGLVCGVFSAFGPFAVAGLFVLTCTAVAFATGLNEPALWCLLEIVIGAFLFFITPGKWLDFLREALQKNGLAPDDSLNRFVSAKLRHAAKNVLAAGDAMTQISARLDRLLTPEINVVFSKLQQNICLGCAFKGECWNELYAETAQDILTLSGLSDAQDGRTRLEKRCPRAGALKTQAAQSYTDFVGSLSVKEKIKELRGVVTDQFAGVGEFLNELAEQMTTSRVVDTVKSRTLNAALRDGGIYVDSLHYFRNPNGRITIEITMLEDAFALDQKRLRRLFESTTGRRFEPPEIALMELRTTLTFEERAAYRVITGKAQIALKETGVCGDSTCLLTDPAGNRVAILSDGMGSGARAAVDSMLTCALMEHLLHGGFSFPAALKMVNCALMVKSADESMATVDGVSVNIYTGAAALFKAGAAASFLRRGDTVTVLEEVSMPVGILRSMDVAQTALQLAPGDLLLLVSDGVTAGDCGWISDELLAWSTNNMDDLASHIAALARLRSDDTTRDDVTAIAVKLMQAERKEGREEDDA